MRATGLVLLVACASQPARDGADAGPGSQPESADAGDAAAPADAEVAATYPCAPAPVPGHQQVSCPDGVKVDVTASAACAGGGCGLILDLHGLTGSGDEADAHTRMRALGPPAGYVVLQPTSPGQLQEWSSGMWDASVWSFVRAARDRFAVDGDRVHVMGFSQGGMLTLRLLCEYSEEIASVAPSAGGGCFSSGGGPAVPRPILYTHGTSDAIVAFSYGAAVRAGAIARYGLSDAEVFAEGARYEATRWTGDGGEVLLEFWQHDFTAPKLYGFYDVDGHCLPGPVTDQPFRCRDDGQYDHSLEVLRFFHEHPRR